MIRRALSLLAWSLFGLVAAVPAVAQEGELVTEEVELTREGLSEDIRNCGAAYGVDSVSYSQCLSEVAHFYGPLLEANPEFFDEAIEHCAPEDKQLCGMLAIVSVGDAGGCAMLESSDLRAACASSIAQLRDDASACHALKSPPEIFQCATQYVNLDWEDAPDCAEFLSVNVPDKDWGNASVTDYCLTIAAAKMKWPGMCESIENPEIRSRCIFGIMIQAPEEWTDPSICEDIVGINMNRPEEQKGVTSPEGLREICGMLYALGGLKTENAAERCMAIKNKLLREICLYGAANQKGEKDICADITIKKLRDICDGTDTTPDTGGEGSFSQQILAFIEEYDRESGVAMGALDPGFCAALTGQGCKVVENTISLEFDFMEYDVKGEGQVIYSITHDGYEACPPWRNDMTLTFSGVLAGLIDNTARGDVAIVAKVDGHMVHPTTGECRAFSRDVPMTGTWEGQLSSEQVTGTVSVDGRPVGFTLKGIWFPFEETVLE